MSDWCWDSPHHVIIVDVDRDVLEFIGNVKVVLLTPKWLQRLKGCRRPAIEII